MSHSPEFEALVDARRSLVEEITWSEAQARLKGTQAHLIDVREDEEWNAGSVIGAKHLGRGVIERDIRDSVPDKETPLLLFCGGGFRSVLAGANLKEMGYRNVASIIGGYKEARRLGLPMTPRNP